MDDRARKLVVLLNNSVDRLIENVNSVAVAFSGGLDSTVITSVLKGRCGISLYTVGVKDAYDFPASQKSANALDLPVERIIIDRIDILNALPTVARIASTSNPVRIAILMPLYFVAKKCKEKIIFTGQGADELFGGYHRYLSMNESSLTTSLKNDLGTLLKTGVVMEDNIAKHFSKEIRYIFLDDDICKFAMNLSVANKVAGEERKIILRKAATVLGLPEEIANSRKRAAQYSSGIMKAIQKIAREREMTVLELTKSLVV